MTPDLSSFSRLYLELALATFEYTSGDIVWLYPRERGWPSAQDLSAWVPALYSGGFPVTVADIQHDFAQRPAREFKAEHGLTQAEFAEDHWQTLFAIQYPEFRDSIPQHK